MADWRRLINPRVFVAFLALTQLAILTQTQIVPLSARIWQVRSQSALERSARLAFGEDFAAYIQFLTGIVPADGKVIIPPLSVDVVFGNIGIVQYYLYPRRIDNCGEHEIEACLLRVTGKRTYILALPGFPPRELAEQSKVLAKFDAERGVYGPRPDAEGEASP